MPHRFILAVAIFMAQLAASANAAVISGIPYRTHDFAEAISSSDLQFSDGSPFSVGDVLMICIDVTTTLPVDGVTSTFSTEGGASALEGGGGTKGVAAVHWAFDEYFDHYFKNGTQEEQWAFQYLLWEIGNDFDGSVSSIDPADGWSNPVVDPYFSSSPLFQAAYMAMYQGLIARLPTLPDSYVSTKYTLDLLINADSDYQNMVAIYTRAAAVPLNLPIALLSAMMAGLALRRRRALW